MIGHIYNEDSAMEKTGAPMHGTVITLCHVCGMSDCEGECVDILLPSPIGSKHHRKETVGRPGRCDQAEMRYRGNSSMAPRKCHDGKGKTLRDKRS